MRRVALFLALAVAGVHAASQPINTIKSLRTVPGGVELELHSTREFPVRDEIVILRVGRIECDTCSRSPDDGSLETLIFSLTAAQFAETRSGDVITVRYGRESTDLWNFGPLDKSLLDRQ